MYEIEKSIFIKRSLQEVFDAITDPTKAAQWQSFIDSADWTSEGPVGVGSTWKSSGRFLGRNFESELQIMGWEPPHMVSIKTISGPIPVEVTHTLKQQENGTLLTQIAQAEFGGFFKLAEGLVGKQVERQIDTDNNTLKLLMESNQL
jgi:carbon monoxide dehydrogenase subunit G